MSINSLPVETLEQIFSSGLKQVDLARLCQVSKLFLIIGRPQLYRSITLYSIRQVDKFKESRQEDAKLVEEVRIIGKENPWEISKMEDLAKASEAMSETQKQQKVAGVVKRLLEGEIVDPAQLCKISIYRVVEDPTLLLNDEFSFKPKIFPNLVDLTIVSNRGGFNTLEAILKPEFLPNLARLSICDCTRFDWSSPHGLSNLNIPNFPNLPMTSDLRFPSYNHPVEFYIQFQIFADPGTSGLNKLRLVVSLPFSFVRDNPSLLHLVILDHCRSLLPTEQYTVLYVSSRAAYPREIEKIFNQLRIVAARFFSYSLKYLALPSAFKLQLSASQNKILGDLINLGVAVHFDGDLGTAIAPPSFFEFFKKEKQQQKEEEETRGQELSQE
ncbi:hypothetical protein JCM3765_004608 [Sporobolomyces pararoseus]